MADLARLSVETRGDLELARVAGELDASNVAEISEELLGAVSNQARAVVLDLSQTSYIDSSGISLIFDAVARLRNRRQELRLVVPLLFLDEMPRVLEMLLARLERVGHRDRADGRRSPWPAPPALSRVCRCPS